MKKTLFLLCGIWALLPMCTISEKRSSREEPETSSALPQGMHLVWQDEFTDGELDRSKWFTQYYSQLDYVGRANWEDFKANRLPEPGIVFTDSTIILITNDEMPDRPFQSNGRKISSIQTYDWNSNTALHDNRLGGFYEARIRRNASKDAELINGAFWFDSPGPDARYFVEKGNTAYGVKGIRPRGQLFEIDMCEYLTTEIVLHGNVSPEGQFEKNIGHYIVEGNFTDVWTVHSILWSPAGLKFYVDGKLVKEWWDPADIKSPNHLMNVFLGAYGKGGTVSMEVDYIRYYQWELDSDNELPNPGFEYHDALFPWEGTGVVSESAARTGKYGVALAPGDSIIQYVYLNHSEAYQLQWQEKGAGSVTAKIENITQVSGVAEDCFTLTSDLSSDFAHAQLDFTTNPEYPDHMRTVKVTFFNQGKGDVFLDDIAIRKQR